MARKHKNRSQQNQPSGTPNPPRPETQVVSASWQGPIPPPAIVEGYDRIIQNGAERIMRMAEKAQDADIAMGSAYVAENKRGQYLGASASIVALLIAGALGAYGLHIQAPAAFYLLPSAFVSIPVFAVIRALIRGGND